MSLADEKEQMCRDERFFDENHLPEFCYAYNPVTGNGIIIKRGESGYYPVDYDCPPTVVKLLNERLGIDECMVEAMYSGSMWGWDVPAAFPQMWYDERANGMDVEGMVYKTS